MIDNKIKIIRLRGKNTVFIDKGFIYDKYSVFPTDFSLYKAIIGDMSDNIKGLHKVGPKTAVNIIKSLKNNSYDKFYDIYTENLETIQHNLNLIELPNKTIDLSKYSLENYEIVPASLKKFKNLKLVTEITNKIGDSE